MTPSSENKRSLQHGNKKKKSTTVVSHKRIADILSKVWNLSYYYKGSTQIVDQVSLREQRSPLVLHAIAHNKLKELITLSSLGKKLKRSKVSTPDEVMIEDFLITQDVPVFGLSLAENLKSDIAVYMKDFDYAKALDLVNDSMRLRVVTPGSSFPQLPVPGNRDHKVTEYLNGIVHGDAVFRPEFQYNYSVLSSGLASCKMIFVPKNDIVKRAISIAPRDATDKQYVLFELLREYISNNSKVGDHITQFDAQAVQHKAIKNLSACTIDLSSASDRVYKELIQEVWPEFMEYFSDLLPSNILLPNGKVAPLTCIGTQGFPLTFLVLSFIVGRIVAISKRSKHLSTNYGDDITCHSDDYRDVYVALESLGFKINKAKSYGPNSPFVESCGVDLFRKKVQTAKNETSVDVLDITPIHLRGESDASVIEFFNQLCYHGMIAPGKAISIMKDQLKIMFYAYPWPYALTDYHFHYGTHEGMIYNGFKPKYRNSRNLQRREVQVPCTDYKEYRYKGLSTKDSEKLIELLKIHEDIKSHTTYIQEVDVRSVSGTVTAHRLSKLKAHKLYDAYEFLIESDLHDLTQYNEWGINVSIACAFRLTVGYMFYYRAGQQDDESRFTIDKLSNLSEAIDFALGIRERGIVSVFQTKPILASKYVPAPLESNG